MRYSRLHLNRILLIHTVLFQIKSIPLQTLPPFFTPNLLTEDIQISIKTGEVTQQDDAFGFNPSMQTPHLKSQVTFILSFSNF